MSTMGPALGNGTRWTFTWAASCCQQPRPGRGMFIRRQVLASARSDSPYCVASLLIGVVQTFSKSSSRVTSFAVMGRSLASLKGDGQVVF